MAISLPQGFKITSRQPIDTRLVLSKSDMKSMRDSLMPQVYLSICTDDNSLYLYDKNNTVDDETGKFRKNEDVFDIVSSINSAMTGESKEEMEKAISVTIPGALRESLTNQENQNSGLSVDDNGNVSISVNDEHLQIVDNKIDLNVNIIQATI